jgi:cytochrome c-type biogenesis protein CcmH
MAMKGRGDEAGSSIARLPPDERNAAIRAMVDALSDRLEKGEGTVEEWQRLIRARMVLGDKEAAERALSTARVRLGTQPASMAALLELARELNLDPLR